MCTDNFRLTCDEYVEDGSRLWFFAQGHNGLYCMNRRTKKVDFVAEFPGEPRMGYRLFKAAVKSGTRIFFAPCNASSIAIFDCTAWNIKMLPIEKIASPRKTVFGNGFKFWTAKRYESYVFFFGHGYPAIIRVDVDTLEIEYLTDWVSKINDITNPDNMSPYFTEGCVCGETGLFPVACTDGILKINLKTGDTNVLRLGAGVDGYNGMAFDGEYCWIVPRNGSRVLRWQKEKNEIVAIETGHQEPVPFYTPIVMGDTVYLPPIRAKHFYTIDRQTCELSMDSSMEFVYEKTPFPHVACRDMVSVPRKTADGKLSFITGGDGVWHIIDTHSGTREDFLVMPEINEMRRLLCARFANEASSKRRNFPPVRIENEENTLGQFLSGSFTKKPATGTPKNFTTGGNIFAALCLDAVLANERA